MGVDARKLIVAGLMEMLGAFILTHTYIGVNRSGFTGSSSADFFGYAVTVGLSYMLLIQGLKVYANPAVCLAAAFRGTLDFISFIVYFLCQVVGAFMGTVIGNMMFDETIPTIFGASAVKGEGFLLYFEALYSLIIILISLRSDDTATKEDESHDNGTAIAAAYAVGCYIFGGITGGIYNPAVAFGFFVGRKARKLNSFSWSTAEFDFIWVHLMAPFAAAFVAAIILWMGDGQIFWANKGGDDAEDDA